MTSKYKVTWITGNEEQEQITEVTALNPVSAARTVQEIEEIINDHDQVMITGVQRI